MSKKNPEFQPLIYTDGPVLNFKPIGLDDLDVEPRPSGPLYIPPEAVHMHMLRYGLNRKGSQHDGMDLGGSDPRAPHGPIKGSYRSKVKISDSSQSLSRPDNAPEIPGYEYYGAPVREGWLYIYNETTELWYEYKILAGGMLQSVVWERFEDGYDEREPDSGAKKETSLKVPVDQTVWLAYSEVQWSYEYIRKVFKDTESREKRMQRIACDEWMKELSGENVASVSKVCASEWEYDGVRNISYDVYTRDYKLCKAMDSNDHHLYVYLHDPIGAADDVTQDLAYLYAKFDALVASLGSSKSPEDYLDQMLNGAGDTDPEQELPEGEA